MEAILKTLTMVGTHSRQDPRWKKIQEQTGKVNTFSKGPSPDERSRSIPGELQSHLSYPGSICTSCLAMFPEAEVFLFPTSFLLTASTQS
jgi:hypothetical protein